MKAVVYDVVGGPLFLREVDEPWCPADGAVINVRATGVCRSDWHAWRGHDPVALPHTPGHEFAGVIAAVGEQVARWAVGQRVTASFVNGCGVCQYCRVGEAQVCPDQSQPGFTHPGSFAEQVVVRKADLNLVALPDSVEFVAAASLGCRFATAYRALTAHGQVSAGQWVAVHGCGGVGLSAVMIAAALGARVVATDLSAAALERALELGAQTTLDPAVVGGPEEVGQAISELTGGGAHVSLDALGAETTAVASVLSLRRRGRHVQVGLLLGPAATPPLPMDRVLSWELTIHGSHGMAAHEYPPMLELITSGALDPLRLVGRVAALDDAGAAFAAMDRPAANAGMTVLTLPRGP